MAHTMAEFEGQAAIAWSMRAVK